MTQTNLIEYVLTYNLMKQSKKTTLVLLLSYTTTATSTHD